MYDCKECKKAENYRRPGKFWSGLFIKTIATGCFGFLFLILWDAMQELLKIKQSYGLEIFNLLLFLGAVWFFFDSLCSLAQWLKVYIPNIFIGIYTYSFLDYRGKKHEHLTPPEDVPTYLRFRRSGYFRRSKIRGRNPGDWRIIQSWDDTLTIQNKYGESFCRINIEEALKVILFPSLGSLLHVKEEVEEALRIMVRGNLRLIQEMEDSRDTMGRSRHAQYCREAMEGLIKESRERHISPDLWEKWQNEAIS